MDEFEPEDITEIDPVIHFALDKCRDCGLCTQACPSNKYGGIDPRAIIQGLLKGENSEDVWDCLLCYICEGACPAEISIAKLMTYLRYNRALKNEAPERFLREANLFLKEGRGFPANTRTEKQRNELGLAPLHESDRGMRELGKIISRTRFPYD